MSWIALPSDGSLRSIAVDRIAPIRSPINARLFSLPRYGAYVANQIGPCSQYRPIPKCGESESRLCSCWSRAGRLASLSCSRRNGRGFHPT